MSVDGDLQDGLRLAIAAELEAGDGQDRDLELRIWRMNGGVCPPGHSPLTWLHQYTVRIDHALELSSPASMHDIMHDAMSRVGRKYAMHTSSWPDDVRYQTVMARFVAAAALRAEDRRIRKAAGVDVPLRYIELDASTVGMGDIALRYDLEAETQGAGKPRMARLWQEIGRDLVKRWTIGSEPEQADVTMIEAGENAYALRLAETDDQKSAVDAAWHAMAVLAARKQEAMA